jgi:hypothetical protein
MPSLATASKLQPSTHSPPCHPFRAQNPFLSVRASTHMNKPPSSPRRPPSYPPLTLVDDDSPSDHLRHWTDDSYPCLCCVLWTMWVGDGHPEPSSDLQISGAAARI